MYELVKKLKARSQIVLATLDLETLGFTNNTQVTEAAWVVWRNYLEDGQLTGRVVHEDCTFVKASNTAEVNPATVAWHLGNTQRRQRYEQWQYEEKTSPDFPDVCARMATSFKGLGVEAVFVRGKYFDLPIIGHAFAGGLPEFQKACGVHFHRFHCVRDMEDNMKAVTSGLFVPHEGLKAHAALADCEDNGASVEAMLKYIIERR